MIDLHSHLLPGIDDGAQTPEDAVAMARLAVAAGTTTLACTPHIYPGLFPNTRETIAAARAVLDDALAADGIALDIVVGADIQIVPELAQQLSAGVLPTLNDTRYFLFEPPHHVPNTSMLELVHSCVAAGFTPLITHPERLAYARAHYREFEEAVELGAWLQLTGGAITGRFGPEAESLSKRFLADRLVSVVASDGHDTRNRPPVLAEAFEVCTGLVGEAEAWRLFIERPAAVLADVPPDDIPPPDPIQQETKGFFGRLFG